MPRSLLLSRLSVFLRTGTNLLLHLVKSREQSSPFALHGGVGISVAIPLVLPLPPPARPPPATLADALSALIARDAKAHSPTLNHLLPPPEPRCDPATVSPLQNAVLLLRCAVLDGIVAEMLPGEHCCVKQIVLFGSTCAVECRHPFTQDTVLFHVRDVTNRGRHSVSAAQLNARGVTVEAVDVALEGCAWDAALVMSGFNWLERSMWIVQLDVMEPIGAMERIFRMMAKMGSTGSILVVVYGTTEFARLCADDDRWIGGEPAFVCDDPFALASKCALRVSFLTNLRDGGARYDVAKGLREHLRGCEIAEGVRFAVFEMVERDADTASDITMHSGYVSGSIVSAYVGAGGALEDVLSLGDFEDYLNAEQKEVRFELWAGSLPWELRKEQLGVVVIGSEARLGCWEARRASRMKGDVCGDGVLKAHVLVNVQAGDVEFKYAVVNENRDIVAWEVGENRVLGETDERYEGGTGVRDAWRCR